MTDTELPRSPDRATALRLVMEARLMGLRVSTPARVIRYDPVLQVVDAQPLILEKLSRDDVPELLPVVCNVPVVFPGAGGFRVTFPIRADHETGDIVDLVFSDRSLDRWKSMGGSQDPQDIRKHALADAIAIPGLHDNTKPWTGASTDSMTAGADGGPQIEFRADSINLAGSDDAMALAGKIATQLGALMTALNGWDGLSAASLKLVITALHTAGWPASVASSKVKASGT